MFFLNLWQMLVAALGGGAEAEDDGRAELDPNG